MRIRSDANRVPGNRAIGNKVRSDSSKAKAVTTTDTPRKITPAGITAQRYTFCTDEGFARVEFGKRK